MHGLESAFEGACLVAGSVAHSIRHSETRPAGERQSCGVRSSAYGRRMPGSYLISVCVCAHACVLLCTCVCARVPGSYRFRHRAWRSHPRRSCTTCGHGSGAGMGEGRSGSGEANCTKASETSARSLELCSACGSFHAACIRMSQRARWRSSRPGPSLWACHVELCANQS